MSQTDEQTILRQLGDNIRKRRLQLRMSQSQLAYETETTLRQIQRIERGDYNAGILYFMRIARSLNSTLNDLSATPTGEN